MRAEDHLSERVLADYRRLVGGDGLVSLPNKGLIRLWGEDRIEWLQGQSTNDMTPLAHGKHLAFCLSLPTGQIEAVVDAWATEGDIFLSTDLECVPAVMRRIEHMVIMEDVEGEDLSDQVTLVRAFGSGPEAVYEFASVETGSALDLWLPAGSVVEALDPLAFDILRLERGLPLWGRDITSKTLPPELGPAFEASHVSYTKGCYTGQEILQRIHSRGHTNKTWVALVAEGPLEVGARIDHASREGTGAVSSVAFSPTFGFIGAGTVRNEASHSGEIVTAGGVRAEVRQMPLTAVS